MLVFSLFKLEFQETDFYNTLNTINMNVINIEPTEDTPKVQLDLANNALEFSGISIPEDAAQFYQPIMDWLDDFSKNPVNGSNFVFKLEYFNTASSKVILDILLKIDEINEDKNGLKVTWYFEEDDEDMEEAGEEYSELVEVDFDLKSY